MTQAMDELVAKVTAMETVEASAITLLQTLKSELDTALANNDIAAIQELSNRIGADTDSLAAAVVANTPEVVQVNPV